MPLATTVACLILAPASAGIQAAPSVAEAEANLARAQQILEAARTLDAAERRRIAAEAETVQAREQLTVLQGGTASQTPSVSDKSVPDKASTTTTDDKVVVETKPYTPPGLADNQTGRQKFGGIEFGIGVALSVDLGNNDRIREAEIVDGIVRVTRTDNIRARLILESHYLFTPTGPLPLLGLRNYAGDLGCLGSAKSRKDRALCDRGEKNWGFGPFVALQPGTDNIIDAVGGGLMIGLKRPGETTDAFNIGIGLLYDVDSQILGRGFVEDQAPPGKEDKVRFRRQSQSGFLIMTSYTF